MSSGNQTPVPPFISSSNVMSNGYFGGVTMETANLNCVQMDQREEITSLRRSVDLGYMTSTTIDNDDAKNKYKEIDVPIREKKPSYKDMSAQMKEYNVNYSGLVIIPWEEFAENPRKLNDLFYLEKNGQITYDPDEVNVFFHATKMNKPTFGDISETGKSWVVNIESIKDLEHVRVWLIERPSIFGVTLVRKTSRFGRSERAPCLVMFDPSMGHSDTIHASFMRCINVMQDRKKFCLQIDLNGCVERWCRRITTTKCEAVGAKLIITNGEEPANLTDAENIFCCVVCFPIWSIQTGIYKIHRRAQYKDFELKFDAEELFLYGTLGGVKNQRAKLFKDYQKEIFRTKPIEEAGKEFQGPSIDGHRYTSETKIMRRNKSDEYSYVEGETSSINGVSLKERFNEDVNRTKNPNNWSDTNVVIDYYDKGKESSKGNEDKIKESLRTCDSDKISGNRIEIGLEFRENTNSSDSSGIIGDCKDENKIKSFLEVESCTMRKELSPIQSARTVNSDIMIITQSNDDETPDGTGSEIDLRTFLNTELSPPPIKPKKKSKKHKRNSKPPKPPSKKGLKIENKGFNNTKGIDNGAFDIESENKFRRMLPSKRRSQESLDTIDTLDSSHKPQSESSATCSRDSLDTPPDHPDNQTADDTESINRPSDDTVLSLKSDSEEENIDDDKDENDDKNENDDNVVHQVFQLNEKFQKHKTETQNEDDLEDGEENIIRHDDMSCDDLEFSDLDNDDEDNPQKEDVETNKNSPVRTITPKKQTIRGSAPYRSNRQKYIGMNTSVKNGRLPSLKNK